MALAKLTLTIPEGVWIGDLSRTHPEATVRVLAAFTEDESGVALARLSGSDVESVITAMDDYDAVESVDLLRRGEREALVQFETSTPLLLVAAIESGIPLELPFDIVDGEAVWEVRATRERLSELGDRLDEYGITYRVGFVREDVADAPLLTDRQRDLLRAAVDAGYYDTPRECSLTELADKVGVAKSTASETLHRAEEKVVKQHVASIETPADERSGEQRAPVTADRT